jgi:flagellar biosynthesis protein
MPSERQKAVALGYDKKRDNAPRILAKGAGKLAERILDLARKNNIPINQDTDLIEVLYQLDLDREIPEELYPAIAEILAFVYRLNERRKK